MILTHLEAFLFFPGMVATVGPATTTYHGLPRAPYEGISGSANAQGLADGEHLTLDDTV